MCGIFAYLNHNVERERGHILEVLFNGLRRLEYRGYDSSGVAIDADRSSRNGTAREEGGGASPPYAVAPPLVCRREGKIESLVGSVYAGECECECVVLLVGF